MTTVCVLGGGVHVVTLVELMAESLTPEHVNVRIVARDQTRLNAIGEYCQQSIRQTKPGWQISTSTNRVESLAGADIIVALVRVGGLTARAHDESFPGEVGQIGDEGLGLGGISNTWRTVPFLQTLGTEIAEVAPDATVLNLMAPLPTTTRCLLDHGLRAVGVCELPLTTQHQLGTEAATMAYGGVNHLGWFCPNTDSEWVAVDRATAAGRVDEATVERFAAVPLHYYYRLFDPQAAERLGHAFTPGRAKALSEIADQAVDEMTSSRETATSARHRRSTPWFDQALVPILGALVDDVPYQAFVNNAADVSGAFDAPDGTVVETRAAWSATGSSSQPMPRLPDPVALFLSQVALVDDLAYRAATSRDQALLRQAIEALPLPMQSEQIDRATASVIAGGVVV